MKIFTTALCAVLMISSISVEAKKKGRKEKTSKYKIPAGISYEIKINDKLRNRFKELQKQRDYYQKDLAKLTLQTKKKETVKTATKTSNNSVAQKKQQIKRIQTKINAIYEKALKPIERRMKRLCDEAAQIEKRLKMISSNKKVLEHKERVVSELQEIITEFGSEYIHFEKPCAAMVKKHPWLKAYTADSSKN